MAPNHLIPEGEGIILAPPALSGGQNPLQAINNHRQIVIEMFYTLREHLVRLTCACIQALSHSGYRLVSFQFKQHQRNEIKE